MDKKIILSIGAGIVGTTVIGTAIYLLKHDSSNNFLTRSGEKIAIEEEKNNIDPDTELLLLGADDRYRFCLGEEKISGNLEVSSLALGQEKGQLEYTSKEVALLDTQQNKLVILARSIIYKYDGFYNYNSGIGLGSVTKNESGKTYEYYLQNKAPVRIDLNSNMFFPAPKRKTTDWVSVKEVMRGEMMGVSEERVENTQGDARIMCVSASFGDKIDLQSDNISYSAPCSVPKTDSGVSFSGHINYNCQFVESEKAVEVIKDYLELEKNPNLEKNEIQEGIIDQKEILGAISDGQMVNENNLKSENPSNHQEEIQENKVILKEEIKNIDSLLGDNVGIIDDDIKKLLENIEFQ